jgi:hypothetical protein
MSDETDTATLQDDDGFEDVLGEEVDAPLVDEYRLSTRPGVVSGGG